MNFEKDLRQIELLTRQFWAEKEKKYLDELQDIKYKYETMSAKFLMCEFAYILGVKKHFLNNNETAREFEMKKEVEFIEKIIQIASKELNSNE